MRELWCAWTHSQIVISVLYSYCNSFFIRDVRGEFWLISVHLFDILAAVLCRKLICFFTSAYCYRILDRRVGRCKAVLVSCKQESDWSWRHKDGHSVQARSFLYKSTTERCMSLRYYVHGFLQFLIGFCRIFLAVVISATGLFHPGKSENILSVKSIWAVSYNQKSYLCIFSVTLRNNYCIIMKTVFT